MSVWVSALLGIVISIVIMVVVSRRVLKKLEPVLLQAQKLAQARQLKLAIQMLEGLLPYNRWQLMLASQVHAQIGVFHYADKNEIKAIEHLEKGSARNADGRMILAAILFRKKEFDRACEIMDLTIKLNKKQVLLYNAYAFMLNQIEKNNEAIAILQKGLKINPDNEATRDNLLRLQNGKKMYLQPFGMTWYSLQLEKPPISMMQDQFAGRAGFRPNKKVKSR